MEGCPKGHANPRRVPGVESEGFLRNPSLSSCGGAFGEDASPSERPGASSSLPRLRRQSGWRTCSLSSSEGPYRLSTLIPDPREPSARSRARYDREHVHDDDEHDYV